MTGGLIPIIVVVCRGLFAHAGEGGSAICRVGYRSWSRRKQLGVDGVEEVSIESFENDIHRGKLPFRRVVGVGVARFLASQSFGEGAHTV